jgi:hypothetical protein
VHFDHLRLDMLGDQPARAPFGDHPAMIHDRDPAAQALGLLHEVRREDQRASLLCQLAQPLPDQVARLRVQPGSRLVHEEDLRVIDEGPRKRQAPLHPARERPDRRVRPSVQAGKLQQPRNPGLDLRVLHAEVAAIYGEVLGDRKVGIQVVELRHHADLRARLARTRRNFVIEKLRAAGVRVDQPQAQLQGRRLAGAIRTEQAEAFAVRTARSTPQTTSCVP